MRQTDHGSGRAALLRAAAARHPGKVSVIDLAALLTPQGSYTPTLNGITVRTADGVHLSEAGGQLAAAAFHQKITALGAIRRAAMAKSVHANSGSPAPPGYLG